MTIDNARVVVTDRKLLYLLAIGSAILILAVFVIDEYDDKVLGLSRYTYTLIIATFYVIINIYRFLLDLTYFYFSDADNKIVIRYYSLRPFMQKRRTIEIPISQFLKYSIEDSFFGQKKQLILYQTIKNKSAKYPPISISALNKDELKSLKETLKKHAQVKP